MFALFFSLYLAMFRGTWTMFTLDDIRNFTYQGFNGIGTFLTSIFGDNQMNTLGDALFDRVSSVPAYLSIIALILALITSIGIVVMAVKGIKKVFGIFFMGIRNI